MDYKVLYRKYRPSNFDELIGQNHVKNILKNSIINNRIAHAYIFTGPRGTGKTSTAKIFAKTLNCLNATNGLPCGECDNCINFSTTPDVLEMDAASNNSVDDIRSVIENISIAPTSGKYKIYIIDEVHMLSNQAWNAFLKTLEEPPSNVVFILATTDIQKVPVTVLSRCQRFDFQRIDRNLITNNLKTICEKEEIECTEEALSEIAYLSDGCMRDALSILDQLSKVAEIIDFDVIKTNYGTISEIELDQLYTFIIKNDIDGLTMLINNIKESGLDIKIFIDKLLDNLIRKAVDMKKKNISSNGFKQLKKIIDSLNNLLVKLNSSSNGYLLLEIELISFINDEENTLSTREVNQIISREIISVDAKLDVSSLLKKDASSQIYKICDEFINVRINNTFVDCSKDKKIEFGNKWKDFIKNLENNNVKDILNIVSKTTPQVVSDKYALLMTKSDSIKIVGNSKLYEIENRFKTYNKENYKFIFVSESDWNNYMKTYDKNKKYDIIDEDEFISNESNSVKMAEDLFGSEKLNID